MSRLLALAAVLVGCAPSSQPVEVDPVPFDMTEVDTDQAVRPAPTFDITAPTLLLIGEINTVEVTGTLGEDEPVYLLLGKGGVGAGPCLGALGGLCLDVVNPLVADTALANTDGEATLSFALPASVSPGLDLGLQAFVARGLGGSDSAKSNALTGTTAVAVPGCTDPDADNYDAAATVDDGSCTYPAVTGCEIVDSIMWCYHVTECGQACDSTCASHGLSAMADSNAWFEAQNTLDECNDIAAAFGTFGSMGGYTYACLEDSYGDHTADGGLNVESGLLCSTQSACPDDHRTNMDQLGVPCGPESRRAICPCE